MKSGEDGSDMRVNEDNGNPGLSSGLFSALATQNPDFRQSAVNSSGVVRIYSYSYLYWLNTS